MLKAGWSIKPTNAAAPQDGNSGVILQYYDFSLLLNNITDSISM